MSIKRLNQVVRYAQKNVASLRFPKLEMNSLRTVGYSDATFANNNDLCSQLGRMILLMDDTDVSVQISFRSYKSRRVTISVLSAEVSRQQYSRNSLLRRLLRARAKRRVACRFSVECLTESANSTLPSL